MKKKKVYIKVMKKNIVIDNPEKIDIVFNDKHRNKIKVSIPMNRTLLKKLNGSII